MYQLSAPLKHVKTTGYGVHDVAGCSTHNLLYETKGDGIQTRNSIVIPTNRKDAIGLCELIMSHVVD